MRIVFMGTPGFAVPALSAIAAAGHIIEYVVTQPDKARDRGNKVRYSPVKEKAESLGIKVLQPETLSGETEAARKIAELDPDLIVVAAYGKILPAELLALPKYGCVNIHASLLPRWRGAAPIQRAIIEGDEVTGITIMYMAEGIDTGDIMISGSAEIGKKTAADLSDELSAMGAGLITRAIDMIEKGLVARTPQDENLATYAPAINKKDGMLDFRDAPEKLERAVRGFNPWPGAYTTYGGEMMKIWEAFTTDEINHYKNGTITGVSSDGLEISAGGRTLIVTEIQMPGKTRVKIKEYLKGNKIEKFAVLG